MRRVKLEIGVVFTVLLVLWRIIPAQDRLISSNHSNDQPELSASAHNNNHSPVKARSLNDRTSQSLRFFLTFLPKEILPFIQASALARFHLEAAGQMLYAAAPLELATTWHFTSRKALYPRAPSIV